MNEVLPKGLTASEILQETGSDKTEALRLSSKLRSTLAIVFADKALRGFVVSSCEKDRVREGSLR